MSFQSLEFLAFLAGTAALCRILGQRRRQAAGVCLTAAGLLFCWIGGGWGSVWVLCAGTTVTAAALWSFSRPGEERRRRRRAVLAAVWHIGVLAVFKYTGFLTGGAVSPGWAPLGLSFFTFQQLWLLREAYLGRFRPERGGDLLLHAFFFPTLVSGPIVKPQRFFPQLTGETFLRPGGQDAAAGLFALCRGLMKKVLLADNLGVVVNNGWSRLGDLSAPAAWLVILGYTLQLYFDFSGYCDMAAGASRLLGVRLPVNFNSPYRSLSVGEFWKRWHMTLTDFLRECLYFPLGGSRRGEGRTYVNILIVYLVSGLWHGAGWTFLVWGGLHGLAQVLERLAGRRRERLPAAVRWGLTFAFVNFAWVFFRAPGLAGAGELLRAAVTGGLALPERWLLDGLFSKEVGALTMLVPALEPWRNIGRIVLLYGAAVLAALWPRNTAEQMDRFRPGLGQGILLTVGTAWAVLSFTGVTTFIYSNF